MSKPKLLIVEDDLGLCAQYRWAFPAYRVLVAHDRRQAEATARREQPAIALVDLGLPPDPEGVSEGFATLAMLRALSPLMPVIVASGQGDRENMLRALRVGAYDFCEKPADLDVLRTILDRALRLRELEDENQRLAATPRPSPVANIITADEGMLRICRMVERLATVNAPVLLLGESGTGKEALARALHDMGPRAARPFIAINCAAIPEALLESELFGHERGAFTGAVKQMTGRIEQADGGTLFLDEVGDLPQSLQAKLLRFLQDQVFERVGGRIPVRVDVRVVSATNQPLETQAAAGKFRGDLLFRLNPMTVRVPPLRERGDDIMLLARMFLARYAQEFQRRLRGFEDAAIQAMTEYSWPGNVRELGNRVQRAVLMATGPLISAAELELAPGSDTTTENLDLRAARGRAERETVARALARAHGGLSTAARLLGISRPTLYGLLATHGLMPERDPPEVRSGDPKPSTHSDPRR